jgi:hypothetical protein
MPLNDAPPEYIKEVVAYKEGDNGIFVYVILADTSGAMTTADGAITLEVNEVHTNYKINSGIVKTKKQLFIYSKDVKKEDFIKTKVGIGAFEHKVIMVPLGRITYDQFMIMPAESVGEVFIRFYPVGGEQIIGKTSILF